MDVEQSTPFAKLRKTFDKTGRLCLKEEYLDKDGKPTTNAQRIYGVVHEYDALGRIVKDWNFDADGQMTAGRARYAYIEYTYDETGARTAKRYTIYGYEL